MSSGDNFGLNSNYQYYEIALDSLDNEGSYTKDYAGTDWPQFRLTLPITNIAAIKVLQVEVPVTYYVINKHNNTFILTESTKGPSTVRIPVGNYMAEDLVYATKEALDGASLNGHKYSGEYNPLTAKATYKSVEGHAFTLSFGAPTNSGNVNPRLWLGFKGGDITSFEGKIVTPNVMLATGPNYVYLNSRTIGTDIRLCLVDGAVNISSGGKGPQMAKIPINVNPNEVVYWNGFFYIYIDPDPQKYFDLENRNNFPLLDFYFTLGNTSQPIEFNGVGFSIKLGLLANTQNSSSIAPGHIESGRKHITTIQPVKRPRGN